MTTISGRTRAYLAMKSAGADYLKRLAFFTVAKTEADRAAELSGYNTLSFSKEEDIDCVVTADDGDRDKFRRALDCYETFKS